MLPTAKKSHPIHVHNTGYVSKITPIQVCGNTVMWELTLDGVYRVPFQINPTTGPHDYKKCQPCKKTISNLTKVFKQKMIDKGKKKGFPFCCPGHSNLPNVKEFDKKAFDKVPLLAAQKVVFTIQQFINAGQLPDWEKRIYDYLEWVIISFGEMPKDCGEPLFLTAYFFHVKDLAKRNTHIATEKNHKILKLLDTLQANKPVAQTDLNILATVYERWIRTFPFQMNSYFGDLKDEYSKKLIFLRDEMDTNMYSGLTRRKMHTKESLQETLISLTNKLLTDINGVTLYEKGLISDTKKIRLELLINSRKHELLQGYANTSTDEDHRYKSMIKKWFADEKRFFDELVILLKGESEKIPTESSVEIKAPVISLFCYILSETSVFQREPDEPVLRFCKRVCNHYKLKCSDRVRQGFLKSWNNSNIKKVKNLIFPRIDQKTRDAINQYLDTKTPAKQKMYA